MRTVSGVLSAVVVLGAARVASADEVTFTGGSGSLSASATFATTATPGQLSVTLTNTSSADCLVPSDILTAVFFNAPGTLTPVSATVAAGSIYLLPASTTNVGGEWAYKGGISGPSGTTKGISTAGFNIFGPPDSFPGPNLDGQSGPQGFNLGIVSAGDNPATGNGGNGGMIVTPLIKNSVPFILSGWSGSLADIGNIWFQYGTALGGDEPGFPGGKTPEPASMVLLGIGAAGLLVARRRKNAAV